MNLLVSVSWIPLLSSFVTPALLASLPLWSLPHLHIAALTLLHTGWPKKNATLAINNFKQTRDRMKKLCAFLRIKFVFQQNDTKIINFDEGVLILEPFFWGNVIFKICTFCIKSHVWRREEFLWVAPRDSNAAKLRNECFSLFMLASLYKARADTSNNGKFSVYM